MGKEALGLQEGFKAASLNERLLFHHLGGDLLNLGSELSLSGLVSLGLGSALGYRGSGLLPPGGSERRSWGRRGDLLLEGLLMLAVSPKLASSTGAAPGIREIIAVLFRGEREPGSVREGYNLGKSLLQAQELS